MNEAQTYTGTLAVIVCGNCGITFGLDESRQRELQRTHKSFYCPNGHYICYSGKSDADKLADERKRHARREVYLSDQLGAAEADRDTLKFKVRAEKAAKTRIKNRVAKGVCPCCQRTFTSLGRHMKSKHPNFTEQPK